MSGIVAQGVRRSFGDVHAVADVTFHALPGKITGLVGPNGAGKTTLMLMLASLLAPDAGSISIEGTDPMADAGAVRRMLGWMPDALGAWPALTARESITMTARLHDISKPEAQRRADELLALVGLTELADAQAKVLSRGQKQKLGLARALVHDPQVLLLDEPASGLDPAARIQLRVLLRQLASQGKTILISSHVLSELEEVIDAAVFMVAGSTVDAGENVTARTYRVRILNGYAAASVAETLGLPAESVVDDRGAALVSFADEAAAVAGLRALVSTGVAVAEFAPAQSSLETSFLALQHPQRPNGGAAS